MITQDKWEYSVTYLFVACSVLLLILMIFQYGYGVNYRSQILQKLSVSESSGFTMQEIPDYHFSEKVIADYQDIVQRPLFFKLRKPIVPPADDQVTETGKVSDKFEYTLTGVINTPRGIYCLLQNQRAKDKDDKFKRLEQGEEINGWVIKEIHPDRVVIVTDGKSEEIPLAKPRLKKLVQAVARRPNRKKPTVKPKPQQAKKNPFQHRSINKKQ